MSDLVRAVCDWASKAGSEPLGADLVPGTTAHERRRLAALGGLVRALAGNNIDTWPNAVQEWAQRGPRPPDELIRALRHSKQPTSFDIFAASYERLVDGQSRRRLGTFFTPSAVVDLMIDRSAKLLRAPAEVVDPGAGVGAFSVAAHRRWRKARIAAVDVNVVTLGLLGARAVLEGESERLELIHADYLDWITREATDEAPPTRLLLGNPPYTRHQELDQKLKASAMEAAEGLVESGLAGLAAYFLGASLRTMRDGDAMCFVLPGSWTEARYGHPLREWLWERTDRVVDLLPFSTSTDVFPGTRVTAMVLVVGPATSSARPIRVEQVKVGGSASDAQVAEHNRSDPLPQSFGPMLWPRSRSSRKQRKPLVEIGRVRRGVATGANHFFFLTDGEAKGVPRRFLLPGLRRLRHVEGDTLDASEHDRIGHAGLPRWLLALGGPEDAANPAIAPLLERGIAAGYHDRYLARDRPHWYAVERIDAPDVLVALMTKERFRAIANPARTIPSNSIYGIYLKTPEIAIELVAWINSDEGQDALKAQARHYSEGLFKLEPRDYMRVMVPAKFT